MNVYNLYKYTYMCMHVTCRTLYIIIYIYKPHNVHTYVHSYINLRYFAELITSWPEALIDSPN